MEKARADFRKRVRSKIKQTALHNLVARDIVCLGVDTLELLTGRRNDLIPPSRLRIQVCPAFLPNYFVTLGETYVRYFRELGGLKPDDAVLDIGCGCGQAAIPLTGYLNRDGRYEGVDIVSETVGWCRKNITPRFPNFNFQVVDVFNKHYNPRGTYEASRFKFPFDNGSFDFVYLKSVFTHMLPPDMENYFSEITRVLKKDGRCFISFILLHEESRRRITEGKSMFDLKHHFGAYSAVDPRTPEYVLGYDEDFIRGLYEKYGLSIAEPIHHGSWYGNDNCLDIHDIIVARKR